MSRPDLVGFVNGLPLVVIELKKPGVPARAAFGENLTHDKTGTTPPPMIPLPIRCGEGHAVLVRRAAHCLERHGQPRRVSLEVMLRGTCDRVRLLDLVENFTLFSEHKAGLVKIVGQNQQFLGMNNALASMFAARKLGHGRGAFSGRPKVLGNLSRWCPSRSRCCARWRATGRSWS